MKLYLVIAIAVAAVIFYAALTGPKSNTDITIGGYCNSEYVTNAGRAVCKAELLCQGLAGKEYRDCEQYWIVIYTNNPY